MYGIICFNMGFTLREGNREYYYSQPNKKFPKLKGLYIKEYGSSYELNSIHNSRLMKLFHDFCKSNNIEYDYEKIFKYLDLFEEKERFEQLYFLKM